MLRVYYYRGNLFLRTRNYRMADNKKHSVESNIWKRMLRRALADIGKEDVFFRLTVEESGRPYLQNSKIELSPTHTQGFIAVAICDEGRVGLDAETVRGRDAARLLHVSKRWFSPAEFEKVEGVINSSPSDAETAFLEVWTAKEAMVKRLGTGLAGMQSVDSTNPDDCVLKRKVIGDTIVTVAKPVTCRNVDYIEINPDEEIKE